jgi:hypothetical protein
MRKDTRSPGTMHLERLAAKYVRSGMSEAGSKSGTRSKSATWTPAPRRVDTSRRRESEKRRIAKVVEGHPQQPNVRQQQEPKPMLSHLITRMRSYGATQARRRRRSLCSQTL